MEFKITTFKIKIKKDEKEVVMFSGGFTPRPAYRIVQDKIMRKPTSYEYQKIYKKLRAERPSDYFEPFINKKEEG